MTAENAEQQERAAHVEKPVSSERFNRLALLERGETLPVVRGKCRVCLEPLPKGRRGFCSDGCRDAYYMATSGEFLRFKVFERDKGVCAACGLDCDALEQRVWGFSTMVKRLRHHQKAVMLSAPERTMKAVNLVRCGFARLSSNQPRTLWEADHVEPLADGGGYTLDNVETLCQPCHIKKTSNEAGWRAKRRKLVGKKQTETMRRFKKMGIL